MRGQEFISALFLASVENSTPKMLQDYWTVPLAPNIEQFCFPDAAEVNKSKLSKRHIFVLTDAQGDKQYGHCHRFRSGVSQSHSDSQHILPYCLCILSYCDEQWNDIFEQILAVLAKILFSGASSLSSSPLEARFKETSRIVQSIMQKFDAATLCGERTLQIDIPSALVGNSSISVVSLHLLFPKSDSTSNTYTEPNFDALARSLGTANRFIVIFIALLLERRIVFFSSNLQRLTDCVFASMSMIQPFSWKNIFIPIVPQSLLNYCTAPMPFIVGIHSSHVAEVKKLPVDEILFVNVDSGELKAPYSLSQDVTNIPIKWGNQLKQELASGLVTYRQGRTSVDSIGIAMAFRNFFFAMLYDYRNYFEVSPGTGKIEFNSDEFIANQSRENKPMCVQFCSSQLFHSYVFETCTRMESQNSPQHQFEKDLFQYIQQHPKGLMEQFTSGFSSVLSKYKTKKELYNNNSPSLSPVVSRQPDSAPPPLPPRNRAPQITMALSVMTAQQLLTLPPPPIHPMNDLWNENPQNATFAHLHNIFSPIFDRQSKGVLIQRQVTLPLIDLATPDSTTPAAYGSNTREKSTNLQQNESLNTAIHSQSLLDIPNISVGERVPSLLDDKPIFQENDVFSSWDSSSNPTTKQQTNNSLLWNNPSATPPTQSINQSKGNVDYFKEFSSFSSTNERKSTGQGDPFTFGDFQNTTSSLLSEPTNKSIDSTPPSFIGIPSSKPHQSEFIASPSILSFSSTNTTSTPNHSAQPNASAPWNFLPNNHLTSALATPAPGVHSLGGKSTQQVRSTTPQSTSNSVTHSNMLPALPPRTHAPLMPEFPSTPTVIHNIQPQQTQGSFSSMRNLLNSESLLPQYSATGVSPRINRDSKLLD